MQNSHPVHGQDITTGASRGIYDASTHTLITEHGERALPTHFHWEPATRPHPTNVAFDTHHLVHTYPHAGKHAATIFTRHERDWYAQRETITTTPNARDILRTLHP